MGNICKEHGVEFFKTKNMRSPAHKIEGTDKWCNEPTLDPNKLPPPQPMPEVGNYQDKPPFEPSYSSEKAQRIETQTAVKEVGEDWRAGKIKDDNPLVLQRKITLLKWLDMDIQATEMLSLFEKLTSEQKEKLIASIKTKLAKKPQPEEVNPDNYPF